MKLARYGYDVLIVTLLIAIGMIIGGTFVRLPWLQGGLIALGIFLALFTLWFFRDPERDLPAGIDDDAVISPADGRVFLVHDVQDTEYHMSLRL